MESTAGGTDAAIEPPRICLLITSRAQERECKKICVTGILTNLLKGQQNAI